MSSEGETNQQDQWKQNLLEDLLKIDFLGIFSGLLLLWIGVHYIIGVVEDFSKK